MIVGRSTTLISHPLLSKHRHTSTLSLTSTSTSSHSSTSSSRSNLVAGHRKLSYFTGLRSGNWRSPVGVARCETDTSLVQRFQRTIATMDLVIDHSVQVDVARSANAVQWNLSSRETKRDLASLSGGQVLSVTCLSFLLVLVNLEYLGRVVFNTNGLLYPDSVVGIDSHTTMIDGLGVAGWGVGGIEAEAAMLGQPMSMVLPGVVGFKMSGKLRDGVTATDLVLTVTQMLRKHGVVGKFVEFYEFSPMVDPSFEAGRPGESAVELGRIIDRGLRESRAIDTESLCVLSGKLAWSIRIDIHKLDNGGNLVDAANIASLAALKTFRMPECSLAGEDGQEVTIHSPEVQEPLSLIIHHLPIAVTFAFFTADNNVVIDPSHYEEAVMKGRMTVTINTNGDICAIQKGGGVGIMHSVVMQCLRIASVKAGDITSKINKAVESYELERNIRKIKRHPPAALKTGHQN